MSTALGLRGRRVPRYARLVCAVAAIAFGGLSSAFLPTRGIPASTLVALLAFLIAFPAWSFAVEGRRHAMDRFATTVVYASFVAAIVPLAWILTTVLVRGSRALNLTFLTHSMRGVSPYHPGGGIYHALVGTMEQVLIASGIAVPLGILAAIYLVEYGRHTHLTRAIGFFVDVMTGVPSIIAGLFVYTAVIVSFGLQRTGLAGSVSLAILMIPVVVRATEQMLMVVPADLREASYALGIPKWRTILRVVLPTAIGGIVTGVLLAVARITGETAPLLLTTFLTQSINFNPIHGSQASLPTFVWDQIGSSTHATLDRAWAGALVLIAFVTFLYVIARLVARVTNGPRA